MEASRGPLSRGHGIGKLREDVVMSIRTTPAIVLLFVTTLAILAPQPRAYADDAMKFRTSFTGPNKCLDIVNEGKNNKLQLADCGNYSGQNWSAEDNSDGTVKLRTEFTGDAMCLDVVNDGANNKVQMAACGNYSGQMWRMTKIDASEGPVFVLQNQFTGTAKCLDVVNDGNNNRLQLAACGNFSGQHWHIR